MEGGFPWYPIDVLINDRSGYAFGGFRPRGIIRQPLTKPLGNNRPQQMCNHL